MFLQRILIILSFAFSIYRYGGGADTLLKKGWAALVKDNDIEAITYFELAYEIAVKENDIENTANALLNLGICYYGISHSKGLEYCFLAMANYKKLETLTPEKALYGRSRCLQLISTIYSRQGKFRRSLSLSQEALAGFSEKDSNGYAGLAYSSIGLAYANLNKIDSSEYYYKKALTAQLSAGNMAYLPSAYVKMGDIELKNKRSDQSLVFYQRAKHMADSTANRQAQVTALLAMGRWNNAFSKNDSTEIYYEKAKSVSLTLNDKLFYLKTLEHLLNLRKQQGRYDDALVFRDEIALLKDSMNAADQQRLFKSLEVQFNLAEKDRKLSLLQKEYDITRLSNYLLLATVAFIIILSTGIIVFLRRINSRDKLLLQTKQELVNAIGEQKNIREKYLQNEIEFRESQLSAMAFQILQKNELMQELKQSLDAQEQISGEPNLGRIINRGLNRDKEWIDFNSSFEAINKNFNSRIKEVYPDISPNDLKICALIKLNLSIKEMAGILNISPDSVKTARYRLRKKLSMNTEDNLTDFILKL